MPSFKETKDEALGPVTDRTVKELNEICQSCMAFQEKVTGLKTDLDNN